MTAPVSAAEAHSGHLSPNSQMPIEKKESVIPNTTTSFVLTKNNQKQTVDDTVKYIERQGIKVKSVVPEIGWIETDRTNQHQEKEIEKDTHADVQTPDNQDNNSYTPTAVPSRSYFNSPMNKYFWNRQWNMHMMTKNPDNYANDTQSHVKIGIIDSGITDSFFSIGICEFGERCPLWASVAETGAVINNDEQISDVENKLNSLIFFIGFPP